MIFATSGLRPSGATRRLLRVVAPLALAAFALLGPFPVNDCGAAERVRGTVEKGWREPAPGTQVGLFPPETLYERSERFLEGRGPSPPRMLVTADGEGSWEIEVPPGGPWWLRVHEPDGGTHVGGILVPDLAPRAAAQLRLPPGTAPREVRVVDGSGRPVPGARVHGTDLSPSPTFTQRWYFSGEPVRTDDAGQATVRSRADRPVFLRAVPPLGRGDLAPSPEVEVPADRTSPGPVVLTLPPAVPRRLEVRSSDGGPATGVLVETEPGLPLTRTGETGSAVVPVPADGSPLDLRLYARDRSHARVTLRSRTPEEAEAGAAGPETPLEAAGAAGARSPVPDAPLPIRLVPPVVVRGRVLGRADGEPVAGATVMLWSGRVTRTDAGGRFSFPRAADLEPASPVLAVRAAGFQTVPETTLPEAGDDGDSVLWLEPAAGLSGWVVDEDGLPVPGASLAAGPTTHGPWPPATSYGFALSDGAGRFALPELPHGEVLELRVTADGFAPATHLLPAFAPGEVREGREVRLPAGRTAHLRVLSAAGAPVPAARLRMRPHPGEGAGDLVDPGWRACDDEGTCRVHGLAPGRYDLQAEAPGYVRRTVPGVEVLPGGADLATDLGTLYLEAAAEITGVVRDDVGGPVAGARIEPWSGRGWEDDWAVPELSAQSGPDGRFSLVGPAPDDALDLAVSAAGHVAQVVAQVGSGDSPLEVELLRAATVTGRVVDAGGDPVEVWVRQEPASTRAFPRAHEPPGAQSGDDGTFRLDRVVPGEVHLVAAGRLATGRTVLQLEPGERREDVRLSLGPAEALGELAVSVADPEGRPVPRAQVRWTVVGSEGGSSSNISYTGLDGIRRVERVAVGTPGRLDVDHPEFGAQARTLTPGPGVNPVRVVLQPGGVAVEGRVVDPKGDPVAGARVELATDDAPSSPLFDRWNDRVTASTDDGSFRFPSIDPGTYRPRASAPGWAPTVDGEELRVDEVPVAGLVLELRRGLEVHGRVVADERLRSEVQVEAQAMGPTAGGASRVVAALDPEGRFRLSGLEAGEWLVEARTANRDRRAWRNLELGPDAAPPEVVLDLSGSHRLEGTLRLNGEPAAGFELGLLDRGPLDQQGYRGTRTDSAGRFRFTGVATGEYRLTTSVLNLHRDVSVDGDEELELDLDRSEISGRVIDGAGRAVRGRVHYTMADGGRGSTSTQEDGGFHLWVPPGAVVLRAEAAGHRPIRLDLDLLPGQAVEDLELRLSKGGTLLLDLLPPWPPGGPAGPVHLAWHEPGGARRQVSLRRTVDGFWRAEGLPAGPLRLWIAAPGRVIAELETEATAGGEVPRPLPVTLAPEARLRVRRAVEAGGRPALIQVLDPAGTPLPVTTASWPWVDHHLALDGRIEVTGLPPGPLTVTSLEGEDGPPRRFAVTTVAGEITTLVVDDVVDDGTGPGEGE